MLFPTFFNSGTPFNFSPTLFVMSPTSFIKKTLSKITSNALGLKKLLKPLKTETFVLFASSTNT